MAIKTITVTKEAYDALKEKKERNESFSKTILRITKRKQLRDFFGVLSKESGARFEEEISKARKQRNKAHAARLKRIIDEWC